jgi:hypothetical protein
MAQTTLVALALSGVTAAKFRFGQSGEGVVVGRQADTAWISPYEAGHPELVDAVSDIAVTPHEIFVLDGKNREVIVLGRDGLFRRRFGRRGEGPGDLSRPYMVGLFGDSVWIADLRLQRISLFSPAGRPGRVLAVPRIPGVLLSFPVALLSDGSRAVIEAGTERPGVDMVRAFRSTGSRHQVIGSASVVKRWHFRGTLGFTERRFQPFQYTTSFLVARDGSHYAEVKTLEPSTVTEGIIVIQLASVRSGRSKVMRLRYTPKRFSSRVADSVVASVRGNDVVRREAKAALRVPRFVPPIRGSFVGTDSSVWIERVDLGAGQWQRLNPAVHSVEQISLPSNFTPYAADGRQIWGTLRDEDGVVRVCALRLRDSR